MPGRTTEPLSERIERYERIRRARDHGVSLQSIGRAEGLTKQRVAEILGQGAPTSQSASLERARRLGEEIAKVRRA